MPQFRCQTPRSNLANTCLSISRRLAWKNGIGATPSATQRARRHGMRWAKAICVLWPSVSRRAAIRASSPSRRSCGRARRMYLGTGRPVDGGRRPSTREAMIRSSRSCCRTTRDPSTDSPVGRRSAGAPASRAILFRQCVRANPSRPCWQGSIRSTGSRSTCPTSCPRSMARWRRFPLTRRSAPCCAMPSWIFRPCRRNTRCRGAWWCRRRSCRWSMRARAMRAMPRRRATSNVASSVGSC